MLFLSVSPLHFFRTSLSKHCRKQKQFLSKIIAKVVRLRTTITGGFVKSLFVAHTSDLPLTPLPKHCCDAILWTTLYAHYVDKFDLVDKFEDKLF